MHPVVIMCCYAAVYARHSSLETGNAEILAAVVNDAASSAASRFSSEELSYFHSDGFLVNQSRSFINALGVIDLQV